MIWQTAHPVSARDPIRKGAARLVSCFQSLAECSTVIDRPYERCSKPRWDLPFLALTFAADGPSLPSMMAAAKLQSA
jgi:hypothetical protein